MEERLTGKVNAMEDEMDEVDVKEKKKEKEEEEKSEFGWLDSMAWRLDGGRLLP